MMRHFLKYSIQFNFHNECHWKYSYPTMVKTITSFITRTIIIICIIIIIIRIPPGSIISTSAIGRILNVKNVLISVQLLHRYVKFQWQTFKYEILATYVQQKMNMLFDWREGNQIQLFPQLWFHWCKTIHRNILDRIVFHSLDIVARMIICLLIDT